MINDEPKEIHVNTVKKTGKVFNDDCAQHALCHCICHTNGIKHIVACCYECPYCLQNVVYTGKTNVK